MVQNPILVTGCAGFIGFHVARRLLMDGRDIVGIDNMNAYYDVGLKQARLRELAKFSEFDFLPLDLADRPKVAELFASRRFPFVVHLAAQAGVRHSLVDPHAYCDPIWRAFSTCSKAAAITGAVICCLRPRPRFMARIRNCPFRYMMASIIRSVFMPPPSGPTN